MIDGSSTREKNLLGVVVKQYTQRIIYTYCINLLPIHVHNEFYELFPLSHNQNCGHDECFLTALDVRLVIYAFLI